MHAMRMGIAKAACVVAIDRSCSGRCRGMLVGAPQCVSGGVQGIPSAIGGREHGSAMGAPETGETASEGGVRETRT